MPLLFYRLVVNTYLILLCSSERGDKNIAKDASLDSLFKQEDERLN